MRRMNVRPHPHRRGMMLLSNDSGAGLISRRPLPRCQHRVLPRLAAARSCTRLSPRQRRGSVLPSERNRPTASSSRRVEYERGGHIQFLVSYSARLSRTCGETSRSRLELPGRCSPGGVAAARPGILGLSPRSHGQALADSQSCRTGLGRQPVCAERRRIPPQREGQPRENPVIEV